RRPAPGPTPAGLPRARDGVRPRWYDFSMTAPAITCPWWCTDHRSGPTFEDEQHARLFPTPEGAWVALLRGTLPSDHIELVYGGACFDLETGGARLFAAVLQQAADLLDRLAAER